MSTSGLVGTSEVSSCCPPVWADLTRDALQRQAYSARQTFSAGIGGLLTPGRSSACRRQHPADHGDVMRGGRRNNERVENLVEAERQGPRIGALPRVDD